MKRFLIPQMLHEWRSNLWLIIELMIVSGVVCYLSFQLLQLTYSFWEPLGFDKNNVYTLSLRPINPESREFHGGDDPEGAIREDTRNMLGRLRANPHVEALAVSKNAYPFTLQYMGNMMNIEGLADSIQYSGNLRHASPDIVRVLKLESLSGISPSEMENRMRNGEIILSYVDIEREDLPIASVYDLVGKKMKFTEDSSFNYKAAAIIPIITRTSFEWRKSGMILKPIDESTLKVDNSGLELILRVKAGQETQFVEQFNSDPSLRRHRNVVLHDLQSLTKRQHSIERAYDIPLRLTISMISFFLIIVFLGLLGSFWYRMQQRTSEIALRKVTGASDGDIFRRMLSEASLLFILAFIPGAGLYFLYIYFTVIKLWNNFSPTIIIIPIIFTYFIMQIIVLIGVWMPARRAMSIEPAIALKDE